MPQPLRCVSANLAELECDNHHLRALAGVSPTNTVHTPTASPALHGDCKSMIAKPFLSAAAAGAPVLTLSQVHLQPDQLERRLSCEGGGKRAEEPDAADSVSEGAASSQRQQQQQQREPAAALAAADSERRGDVDSPRQQREPKMVLAAATDERRGPMPTPQQRRGPEEELDAAANGKKAPGVATPSAVAVPAGTRLRRRGGTTRRAAPEPAISGLGSPFRFSWRHRGWKFDAGQHQRGEMEEGFQVQEGLQRRGRRVHRGAPAGAEAGVSALTGEK